MERELDVFMDWQGETVPVGRLWARAKGARQTASFEYASDWLARRGAFSLDPELPLTRAPFHKAGGLFNAFTDPAPDRWGRNLLSRRELRQARAGNRPPRTLMDVDFLTLVEDETRLGALRFADPAAAQSRVFLAASDRPIPPLIQLGRLLAAANRVITDTDSDDDLRLLLAPGASLGGARPKASVRDAAGRLMIAKFPSPTDDWPIPRWEAATMTLAAMAGIDTPESRLETVARRPVFIMDRFDRGADGGRLPFRSALTALGAADGDVRSYMELADPLRQDGARAAEDAVQIWRRMVFNVLVSNTDDHLRNHGYLRESGGWRLAPAYDLNPMPIDVKPRHHALTLDEADDEASLDTCLRVAGAFGLRLPQAKAIAGAVGEAVHHWRDVAAAKGLTGAQIERMASAFDHADLAGALALR